MLTGLMAKSLIAFFLFFFFLVDVCSVTLHQTSSLLGGGGWCISSYFEQQMIPGCFTFTKNVYRVNVCLALTGAAELVGFSHKELCCIS